jgi:GNAT superfamily N-acetyltransferase
MAGFRVRRAALEDLDVLVAQRRRMFEDMGGFGAEEHAVGDREYRRWVRRLMPKGEFVAWIVEAGGRAVAGGAVWLQERQPRPGRAAQKAPYLLSMFTEPPFRGRGLASMIVRTAARWAAREGYDFMTLHGSREGRRVYAKLGWKRTWEMRLSLKRGR